MQISRTVNTIAILALVVTLLYFHINTHMVVPTTNSGVWSQPSALSSISKKPIRDFDINKAHWRFNYNDLESTLFNARFSQNGELIINNDTLSLLRHSSTYLPSELHSDESERIAYLISRSLPAKGSHTLAELLFTYREYTKALEQQDASSASTVDQTQISSQQRQLKTSLQISYFGQAIANSLFEKQNQTQQYLEARAIIRQRSDLDEAQRKSLLEALTSEYQATLNAGSGSVN